MRVLVLICGGAGENHHEVRFAWSPSCPGVRLSLAHTAVTRLSAFREEGLRGREWGCVDSVSHLRTKRTLCGLRWFSWLRDSVGEFETLVPLKLSPASSLLLSGILCSKMALRKYCTSWSINGQLELLIKMKLSLSLWVDRIPAKRKGLWLNMCSYIRPFAGSSCWSPCGSLRHESLRSGPAGPTVLFPSLSKSDWVLR